MKLTNCIRPGLNRGLLALIFGVALSTGLAARAQAQGTDRRTAGIRGLVAEIDRQIAESESSGEYSSIFRNELVLNQRENPWPAVGIYQQTVWFYYTYGDRELDPYPSRLLKITVTTKRSDRHEYAEYVFDQAGRLVFCLESDGEGGVNARRFYFTAGRLIAASSGQSALTLGSRTTVEAARSVRTQNRKLVAIFRNSLE